jgi:hypothetical protein
MPQKFLFLRGQYHHRHKVEDVDLQLQRTGVVRVEQEIIEAFAQLDRLEILSILDEIANSIDVCRRRGQSESAKKVELVEAVRLNVREHGQFDIIIQAERRNSQFTNMPLPAARTFKNQSPQLDRQPNNRQSQHSSLPSPVYVNFRVFEV